VINAELRIREASCRTGHRTGKIVSEMHAAAFGRRSFCVLYLPLWWDELCLYMHARSKEDRKRKKRIFAYTVSERVKIQMIYMPHFAEKDGNDVEKVNLSLQALSLF